MVRSCYVTMRGSNPFRIVELENYVAADIVQWRSRISLPYSISLSKSEPLGLLTTCRFGLRLEHAEYPNA